MPITSLYQILFPTMHRLKKGPRPRHNPQLFNPETFELLHIFSKGAMDQEVSEQAGEEPRELTLGERATAYLMEDTSGEPPVFHADDELERKQVRMAMQDAVSKFPKGIPIEIMPRFEKLQNMLIDPRAAEYGG